MSKTMHRIGLYDPSFEQDACGVGFLARPTSQPSRDIVEMALEAVVKLTHRGALDADAKTGDGAGILVQVPRRFFAREVERMGLRLERPQELAVAMVFLPQDEGEARRSRQALETRARNRGVRVLGWREVPVDPSVLGDKARSTMPRIEQMLAVPATSLDDETYERVLYLARKEAEADFAREGLDCYIPSFSHRTVVYKGLLVAWQLRGFSLEQIGRAHV